MIRNGSERIPSPDSPQPPVAEPVRSRVMLVDDEPQVLEGLTLHLRRRYDVVTAANGAIGLAMMNDRPPAVVISDMRMPGMDGATFLAAVHRLYPSTVRILLTGQANVGSAIAAINDGQVFRFLTKPCPPANLLATVAAAVEQHELIQAERVLLQQTLHGSVEALLEVLSLANPVVFGWGQGTKRLVGELAGVLHIQDAWMVELAAMFSQLGLVSLPADVAEKVHYGHPLSDEETEMVARVPAVTDRLLAHIPRLHSIRAMLDRVARDSPHAHASANASAHHASTHASSLTPGPVDEHVRVGAQLLSIATRFLQLEARGDSAATALSKLRAREGGYDAAMLDALRGLRCRAEEIEETREVPLALLQAGMVLADAVRMADGQLLAARGYVVTQSFVERCRNAKDGSIVEPARIAVVNRVEHH